MSTTTVQQQESDTTHTTTTDARPAAGAPVLSIIRGSASGGIPAAQAARLADLILGRHHWASGWLQSLFVAQPGFAGHVLEQRPDYGHYLCLVATRLEARGEAGAPPPAELARWLMTTRRRGGGGGGPDRPEVLAALIEAPPAGVLSVLGRLPSRAAPRAVYGQVLELLSDQPTAARLLQRRRLSVPYLQRLAVVPAAYRTAPLLYGRDSTMRRLFGLGATVQRMAGALPVALQGEAEQTFAGVSSWDAYDAWIDRWLREVTFPAPPWEGNAVLRPIRSAPELIAVAQRFGNCLANYRKSAFLGDKCFYVWSERVEVVIEIDLRLRTPLIGLMEGPQRRSVDGVLYRRLVRLLERQGFECPPIGWWEM